MQYQQLKDMNGTVRTDLIQATDGSGAVKFVPNDPSNRDWVAYQAWLAAGNTPQAAS
jgi:hypothetical protein